MNEWRELAACRGATQLFFPENGDKDHKRVAAAKAICAACPVRVECLEDAVVNGERDGIWGGMGPRQRARERARRGLTVPPPRECAWCGTMFNPKHVIQPTCSLQCRKLYRRRYLREHKRGYIELVPGTRLGQGHGSITRYHAGCHCPACRAVAREKRALIRARVTGETIGAPELEEAS